MHGTSPSLLHLYLAEQWWGLKNNTDDKFECFLRDAELQNYIVPNVNNKNDDSIFCFLYI